MPVRMWGNNTSNSLANETKLLYSFSFCSHKGRKFKGLNVDNFTRIEEVYLKMKVKRVKYK